MPHADPLAHARGSVSASVPSRDRQGADFHGQRSGVRAADYFKKMAAELGMPYQNLINLFLRDCAIEKRRPVIQWPRKASKRAG
jgi:hypothetical protein